MEVAVLVLGELEEEEEGVEKEHSVVAVSLELGKALEVYFDLSLSFLSTQ